VTVWYNKTKSRKNWRHIMAKYKQPDFTVRTLSPEQAQKLADAGAKCICQHTGERAQGAAVVQPVRDCQYHGEEVK
jgi:hypothetical protein